MRFLIEKWNKEKQTLERQWQRKLQAEKLRHQSIVDGLSRGGGELQILKERVKANDEIFKLKLANIDAEKRVLKMAIENEDRAKSELENRNNEIEKEIAALKATIEVLRSNLKIFSLNFLKKVKIILRF